MITRNGFTLTEVLVSLLVFSIVSTAMVGALLMGSRLFREGEMARAANDEAMSILAMLDRDIEAAIPFAQYGDFYSVIPNPDRPDCAVAWVIANPDPSTAREKPTVCVLWGRDNSGNLRRQVLNDFGDLDHNNSDENNLLDDDPRDLLDKGIMVTDRCRYFGVFLAGTGLRDAYPEDVSVHPVPHSWWRETADANGNTQATPPMRTPSPLDGTFSTNPKLLPPAQRYPSSVRFYLLMEGRGGTAKRGVVVKDNDTTVRVAGLQGLPTTPGSVVVIDHNSGPNPPYEILGYKRYAGGVLTANEVDTDGPLDDTGKTGRGAFRSTKPVNGHTSGNTVHACRPFSLVKVLPR